LPDLAESRRAGFSFRPPRRYPPWVPAGPGASMPAGPAAWTV